ncbi:MAG: hypothetical protein QM765_01340 [Myxococcales bacterium]
MLVAEMQDSRAGDVAKKLSITSQPATGSMLVSAKLAAGDVLAGVQADGTPAAFVLSSQKGTPPIAPLERATLCSAAAEKPADLGAAAPGLLSACERAAKADAEEVSLRSALAAVENGEALKVWKAGFDTASASLFTAAQKSKLQADFSKRKAELGKAESEQLKARLASLEFKDAKEFKASVDGSFVLDAGQKRELNDAFGKRKPALAKAQVDALLAQLAAAEDRASLDQVKGDQEASVLLLTSDKSKVEKTWEKRKAELKKACKLDGADACPPPPSPAAAADAGGAP